MEPDKTDPDNKCCEPVQVKLDADAALSASRPSEGAAPAAYNTFSAIQTALTHIPPCCAFRFVIFSASETQLFHPPQSIRESNAMQQPTAAHDGSLIRRSEPHSILRAPAGEPETGETWGSGLTMTFRTFLAYLAGSFFSSSFGT